MARAPTPRKRSSGSPFVLVPGAGGSAWYWHRLVPLLERAGHEAVAVDLPGDDAGLDAYTDERASPYVREVMRLAINT
jgi:thioesterase domain-containing protein